MPKASDMMTTSQQQLILQKWWTTDRPTFVAAAWLKKKSGKSEGGAERFRSAVLKEDFQHLLLFVLEITE